MDPTGNSKVRPSRFQRGRIQSPPSLTRTTQTAVQMHILERIDEGLRKELQRLQTAVRRARPATGVMQNRIC
jgi:hypothetical protein